MGCDLATKIPKLRNSSPSHVSLSAMSFIKRIFCRKRLPSIGLLALHIEATTLPKIYIKPRESTHERWFVSCLLRFACDSPRSPPGRFHNNDSVCSIWVPGVWKRWRVCAEFLRSSVFVPDKFLSKAVVARLCPRPFVMMGLEVISQTR